MTKLLEVKNLQTQFKTESGLVRAVDDVSYHIDEQEIVGVVGESGCGKSVSQLSVMRLINHARERLPADRSSLMDRTCSSMRPTVRRCAPSEAPR